MRVLTLGGGGNIGYWVERKLLEHGHSVISLLRGTSRHRRKHIASDRLTILQGDVNDPIAASRLKIDQTVDCVIDFICYDERHSNIRKILFEKFSGLYVLVSSVAVYERVNGLNIISNRTACDRIIWPYAQRKREAEIAIKMGLLKCKVLILRAGHTFDLALPVPFGPSNWVIPQRILNYEPLLMHKREPSVWSVIHSIDFAKRCVYTVENPSLFDNTLNIVGNGVVTWSDIAEAFFRVLKRDISVMFISPEKLERAHPYWAGSVKYHKQFDETYVGKEIDLFREKLGLDMSIAEGLNMAIEWYMSSPAYQVFSREDYVDFRKLERLCSK